MVCGKCGNDNGISDWTYKSPVCVCNHCGFVVLASFVHLVIKDEKIQRDEVDSKLSPHSSIE